MATHQVNDRVIIDPTIAPSHLQGVVFVVTKILSVNIDVTPEVPAACTVVELADLPVGIA